MNSSKSISDKIYNPLVCEIGRIFFYAGLLLEIIIFLLDRADWHDPYQSMLFRVTFVFFVIKCLCTRYNRREWIFIALTAAFSILTYLLSGKDEVIRAMVFIISMKGLDVDRTLRFNLILSFIGVVLLGILAIAGVMGRVISLPGVGEKSDALMFEFGLGSPNTWAIQIWLFTALFICLYHNRIHRSVYGILALMGMFVYVITRCRSALLMMLFTCLFAYILEACPRIAESIFIYITGIVAVLFCVAFSIWAAATSKWWEDQTETELLINRITTGRVQSLYAFENGGGVLSNWKLFGDIAFTQYFDMGYVRLMWWYGIIPGTLAILAVFVLMIYQYRHRQAQAYLLTLSVCLFTLLEAHFISPFLSRAYVLFYIGGAWYRILSELSKQKDDEKYHIAFYIGALSKGGAERVFINLAEHFLRQGYQVTMITQYRRDDEYPLPKGAVRYISDLTEEECGSRIHNFFARILKLHRIIRHTGADLLMTTIGKSNFMAICCSAFLPTRVVVSVVAEPTLEYPTPVMKILAQVLFAEADGIVMQTAKQQLFLRYSLRKRSVILPNSVNPAFIRDRYEGPRPHDLYMVGRMDDNKNQVMAISALSRIIQDYPDTRLIICGDGPRRDAIRYQSEYFKVSEHCILPGSVDDVADRLERAYAFLLTSDTEGMPNTLLEAMSLGTPCISTDCPCGGPAQIIQDGVNGILIEVGDTYGLVRAITGLLADPDRADSLGRAAHETMQAYRPDIVNARWQDYFVSLIKSS